MSGDFEPEQKRYLEGFMAGLQIAKTSRSTAGNGAAAPPANAGAAEPVGPDAAALRAQDRTIKAGGKLSDPEKFKRELHPFDGYEKLKDQAAKNEAPKADDNFRWRFFGLFYCAPTQKSYMCRLRIANGILSHWQFSGVGDLAERYAGGYAHVTTRANLQMREVEPKNAVAMVEAIQDLGLSSRGSGADNIRNVTGTPTAGIDPQELIDTRPYAREWHFHILNDRSLYGIPRKFNVGFDGGGMIPVLEDTNDIGFQAVAVKDGFGVEPGIWFKLMLGGITGHQDFARATGVIVKPEDATKVADAVVRVFIDNGDRTNRAKARLKYVLDAWGFEKFLGAMEDKLGHKLTRAPENALETRPPFDRLAHIGAHPQKQKGLHWLGVVLPVGKITAEQMRGIGKIAEKFGDGDIRLTVWQNLLISGIAEDARRRGASRHRGDRALDQSDIDPRRACRLHRQCRLPARFVRHQAPCRGDRALVRSPRAARRPAQHPSHRLPEFLRAALHRRHRPGRHEGASVRGRRSGRGLSHPRRRRFWPGRRLRPRGLSRRQSRRCAADGRAHAQSLSRPPRHGGRKLFGLHPPSRGRCAQNAVRNAGG